MHEIRAIYSHCTHYLRNNDFHGKELGKTRGIRKSKTHMDKKI